MRICFVWEEDSGERGGDTSVELKVVDRCQGCAARDLAVVEGTFAELTRGGGVELVAGCACACARACACQLEHSIVIW